MRRVFLVLVAVAGCGFLVAGPTGDNATRAALAGRSVVMERDGEGVARVVSESTVDRRPRVVGHGRRWMGVPLTWISIAEPTPAGSCDSLAECGKATRIACEDAGYEDGACTTGLEQATIIEYPDGSKLCTAGCCGVSERGVTGGVALVFCSKAKP